jgi:beta-galactosidase
VDGQTEELTTAGELAGAKFWSDQSPNLYDVYCLLSVNGKVVDAQQITTGFRKVEFRGGAGSGGYLFERPVRLAHWIHAAVN